MRLFGVYKGKVYLVVGNNTTQGFSSYREYTIASSYVEDGTFSFTLNNMNMDINMQMSENHYKSLPTEFRGLQSILIIPDGNIVPQARFLIPKRDIMGTTITRYSHGYLQTARSQWYGESTQNITAFISMLKFYDPEVIDLAFLEKIRYINELHEFFKLYTIDVDVFLDVLNKVAAGQMPAQEAAQQWQCVEVDRPVIVKQLTVKDLRPFNLAEIVYWDSLEQKDTVGESIEATLSPPAVKEPMSKPTLKLVANI